MPWAYAGSRLALILRRLRGRFGISAPKVAVRTQIPWHLRALALVVGVLAVVALTLWTFDVGRRMAGFDQGETAEALANLTTKNQILEEEVARLRSLLTASESSLQIERASQKLLSEKHGALVLENNKLREELAVFERLAKLEGKREVDVTIDQLTVRSDSPKGVYRYGFLVSLQGNRRGKEAKFSLQIVVTPRGEGGSDKIAYPSQGESDLSNYEIVLRNFRRIEGRFILPAKIDPAAVEIRILEAGAVRASGIVRF